MYGNLDESLELIKKWNIDEVLNAYVEAPKKGLNVEAIIDIREKSTNSQAKETLIGFANPNLSKKDSINEDDNLLTLLDNKKFKKS